MTVYLNFTSRMRPRNDVVTHGGPLLTFPRGSEAIKDNLLSRLKQAGIVLENSNELVILAKDGADALVVVEALKGDERFANSSVCFPKLEGFQWSWPISYSFPVNS